MSLFTLIDYITYSSPLCLLDLYTVLLTRHIFVAEEKLMVNSDH